MFLPKLSVCTLQLLPRLRQSFSEILKIIARISWVFLLVFERTIGQYFSHDIKRVLRKTLGTGIFEDLNSFIEWCYRSITVFFNSKACSNTYMSQNFSRGIDLMEVTTIRALTNGTRKQKSTNNETNSNIYW